MIVTESVLREQLRPPTSGARVVVPAGATFSPAAREFIEAWQLVLVEDAAGTAAAPTADRPPAKWERPSSFPVTANATPPRCTCCGTPVADKPDGLTQLDAGHYTSKTHPRIKLRGRIDSLHALVLLTQGHARAAGASRVAGGLGTLAAYCRELLSAEYNERPVADLVVDGLDAEALHAVTHDPRGRLGVDHLTIDETSGQLQHWLNVCRATSRELEIVALETFGSPHHPYGASICHAFNRLSSALYYLQLRLAADGGAP